MNKQAVNAWLSTSIGFDSGMEDLRMIQKETAMAKARLMALLVDRDSVQELIL